MAEEQKPPVRKSQTWRVWVRDDDGVRMFDPVDVSEFRDPARHADGIVAYGHSQKEALAAIEAFRAVTKGRCLAP